MNIRIHVEAEQELRDAMRYYFAIDQRLSSRLLSETRALFSQLLSHPYGCKAIGGGRLRQCRLKTFPYVIVYQPQPDDVLVVAFAHARRQPGYWATRR